MYNSRSLLPVFWIVFSISPSLSKDINDTITPHNATDLQPHYRILSHLSSVSHFLITNTNATNSSYSGFIWDFLNELADISNFTFTLSTTPEGPGSFDKESGKWTGMTGQLLSGNTDVIATDWSVTSSRLNIMDFTIPFDTYNLVVLTKHGQFLEGIKYAVSSNADLESLQSLADVDERARNILTNIQTNRSSSIVHSTLEGINLVKQGGWAFVTEDAEIQNEINRNDSQLAITGRPLLKGYYALAVPLGSTLGKQLSIGIAKLLETGRLQKLLERWQLI